MSIIDNALKANRDYAKKHDPKLGQRPAPKIAVVTCMDPRLSNLPGCSDRRLFARSDALLRLQRPRAECARTDQEGQIASLDCARDSCARVCV